MQVETWLGERTLGDWVNKGDVKSYSKYRGIRLNCHIMKIWKRTVEAGQEQNRKIREDS